MEQILYRTENGRWVSKDGDINVVVSMYPEDGCPMIAVSSLSNAFSDVMVVNRTYNYMVVFPDYNAVQYADIKMDKTVKYDSVIIRVKDYSKRKVCFYNTNYKSGGYTVTTKKCTGELVLNTDDSITVMVDSEYNAGTEVALAISYLLNMFLG